MMENNGTSKLRAPNVRRTLEDGDLIVRELVVTRPTIIRIVQQGHNVLVEAQTLAAAPDESSEFWRQRMDARRGIEAILPGQSRIDIQEIHEEVEQAVKGLDRLRKGRD
jgi:hypothetical protein